MRRFTVMGFTEAELGFILAALFAVIAVSTLADSHVADDLRTQLTTLRAEIAKALEDRKQAESNLAKVLSQLHETRARLSAAESEIERFRAKLQSTKKPQCWEKGEQREPIAEVTVIGADRYRYRGVDLSLVGLTGRLQAYISRADELKCRFVVRAIPMRGVDTVDHAAAVWKLRRYFDVNDRPR